MDCASSLLYMPFLSPPPCSHLPSAVAVGGRMGVVSGWLLLLVVVLLLQLLQLLLLLLLQ